MIIKSFSLFFLFLKTGHNQVKQSFDSLRSRAKQQLKIAHTATETPDGEELSQELKEVKKEMFIIASCMYMSACMFVVLLWKFCSPFVLNFPLNCLVVQALSQFCWRNRRNDPQWTSKSWLQLPDESRGAELYYLRSTSNMVFRVWITWSIEKRCKKRYIETIDKKRSIERSIETIEKKRYIETIDL